MLIFYSPPQSLAKTRCVIIRKKILARHRRFITVMITKQMIMLMLSMQITIPSSLLLLIIKSCFPACKIQLPLTHSGFFLFRLTDYLTNRRLLLLLPSAPTRSFHNHDELAISANPKRLDTGYVATRWQHSLDLSSSSSSTRVVLGLLNVELHSGNQPGTAPTRRY